MKFEDVLALFADHEINLFGDVVTSAEPNYIILAYTTYPEPVRYQSLLL
ncbi:MAG: hypothetical protein F6J89_22185 [Symploca sp. SIO1C4]|uniref:Uncharacterized protein n=1 Tax=Symploca sp. SIO1C4 TaxID=2607765 RepID=A0A6B3N9H4_9CYAN|nr:hypothetical protein [Symploca sp. SIO1C4]